MEKTEYKIEYDTAVFTKELSSLVEEITVEQEMDTAWEARIKVPLLVDKAGNWIGIKKTELTSLPRFRVEISTGKNGLLPLIDGHLVSVESPQSSQPGQSSMTLIVQDDTYLMDRREVVNSHERPLENIIRRVFREFSTIEKTIIDNITPPREDTPSHEITQRGSAIHFLRELANQVGFHAYVIPGEKFGKSIGCFCHVPVKTAGEKLPAMILLGSERNIESVNVQDNSHNAAAFLSASIGLLSANTETSPREDHAAEMQGDAPPVTSEHTASRFLPPHQITHEGHSEAARARGAQSRYTIEVTGRTNPNCYKSVLTPYQSVEVGGIGDELSGEFTIRKVTHTINNSSYSQSFVLGRNALSKPSISQTNSNGGKPF